MKIALGISVTTNILLAALLCWPAHHSPTAESLPSPQTPAAGQPERETLAPRRPERITPAQSFRWSQIESPDYHAYISNLRGIGCPEQTIRDIVTADVDEAFYLSRREQLKQQQSGQALEASLAKLSDEETAFVTTLLGGKPAPAAASSPLVSQLTVKSQAERDLAQPIAMPLVLLPADLTAMKLSDTQIQTIQEIRQAFTEKVGTNQSPDDPAYLGRWQSARREADDMVVGMLGRKFLLKYQADLENQATESK